LLVEQKNIGWRKYRGNNHAYSIKTAVLVLPLFLHFSFVFYLSFTPLTLVENACIFVDIVIYYLSMNYSIPVIDENRG